MTQVGGPWPTVTNPVDDYSAVNYNDPYPSNPSQSANLEDCYAENVGAYEGGGYYNHGLVRPQMHCKMNQDGDYAEWCAVCKKAWTDSLAPFIATLTPNYNKISSLLP